MRVPPLYRQTSWQRLFAGMVIGAIISWTIFLYIFGVFQEKQAKILREQVDRIHDLEEDVKIWQEGFKELNKKKIELLTVQKVTVKVTNWKKYDLDPLSAFEAEEDIKEDINMVVAKDLESVYKSKELIKRAIENKVVTINDKKYRFKINEMFIYTTISIEVSLMLD